MLALYAGLAQWDNGACLRDFEPWFLRGPASHRLPVSHCLLGF